MNYKLNRPRSVRLRKCALAPEKVCSAYHFFRVHNICSIFLFTLFIMPSAAFSAKLDISADIETKAASFSNLNFAENSPSKKFFYFQNASLGITVKDLRLKHTSEISMDVGIVLHGISISGSTTAVCQPFNSYASRYPNSDFTPFIEQAYVRISRLFDKNLIFTAGRQSFTLASGLALTDDGLGMTGFKLKSDSFWKNLNIQAFAFQPKASDINSDSINIIGASLEIPSEGLWQIYTFYEIDKSGISILNTPTSSTIRQFTGINYVLRYGFLSFEGEAAIQKGSAKGTNTNINFNGSAFLISGKWVQNLGKLGTGAARFAVGRASGDKTSTLNTDEAFYPSYGHRYKGIERSGFGELYAASLYDAMGGSTSTITGLPAGLSGIQVVNIGVTLPPWKNLYTDIDYYMFEANTSSIYNKQLGNEWDIKISYPVGDKFKLSAVLATFSPGKAYPDNTPSAKKLSIEAIARF